MSDDVTMMEGVIYHRQMYSKHGQTESTWESIVLLVNMKKGISEYFNVRQCKDRYKWLKENYNKGTLALMKAYGVETKYTKCLEQKEWRQLELEE